MPAAPDEQGMSAISPGPATNSSSPANAFEVRAVDSEETGHITSTTRGQNKGGFEASRVVQDPGH